MDTSWDERDGDERALDGRDDLRLRKRIGHLIYSFDALHDGDRTRADYLRLAANLIDEVRLG